MSNALAESPLLTLFREEVRAAVLTLSGGLLGLERAGADAQRLEPLVQAAHSVRGAARVVRVEPAARLAQGIEERLAAAQNGTRPISAADVEALLTATDVLARIAENPADEFAIEDAVGSLAREGKALPAASSSPKEARQELRPPISVPSPVSAVDAPLLELFREEVRSQTQALSTGLIELERTPGDAEKIEPLMRAAHSIKGAARVVNLEMGVRVAHIAEDLLVAAQKGSRVLTPDDIDVLLAASDLLGQLGEAAGPDLGNWLAAHEGTCAEILERLQAAASGETPLLRPSVIVAPAPRASAAPPREEPVPAAAPAAEERERVVRVTAQSLTRLMGLAGESLVEARWLQPFAGSLLALKRQQDRLAEVLDDLWQSSTGHGDERVLVEDARRQLSDCTRALGDRIGEFESHSRQSDDLNSRLYREVIASRMRPFLDGAHGFPRLVRDLARQLGKQVQFDILGGDTDVDRDILEKLEAPLNHLLRNALDHGMEMPEDRAAANKAACGRLELEARHNAGMLRITVADDGRGIDTEKLRRKATERGHVTPEMAARLTESELLEFLFLPGFSTAERVTEVSGRGVGLDVVHSMVHAVGGSVRIQTRLGQGTRFQLQLPITLSVIRAVLIDVAEETYAFPLNRIGRLLRLPRGEVRSLEGRQYITADGRNVGLVLARQVFDAADRDKPEEELFVVLFSSHSEQYGLAVDGFRGEQDLVVRPLDPRLGKVPNISAAALLDDGSPVLIADVEDLTRSIEEVLKTGRLRRTARPVQAAERKTRKRVLVVDDSITVREVQRQLLANKGFEVETAVDGLDGLEAARGAVFDLIVSDIDMPRLNGLDFVRSLKGDERLHSIPVIIVSYKDREEDRLRGLEAGANYYLTKSSFHDDRLLNAVEELIGDP